MQISSEPPKIDVLLLRKEVPQWTPIQLTMVPDGLRTSTASHILIEFKYSESLTRDAILQALGYEYFYRTSHNLSVGEIQIFILCAKTPRAERLKELGYSQTVIAGVYENNNLYASHVPLILLNELAAEPFNAFVKAFASRKLQKAAAFKLLREFRRLPNDLLSMLEVLQVISSLPEEATMKELLTPERVLEIGETWKKILLGSIPVDELDSYITPEYKELLMNQGIEQGKNEERREIVLSMHAKEFSPELIADVTDVSVETVQAWIAAAHDSSAEE